MTAAIAMSGSDPWRADAARYKVMWRIVPSVNHKLAGSMQPITMLASMLVRHVQRPQPDMQALTKLAVDMQQACKAAITTRPDVLAWFQPSEDKKTSIATEVAQCDNLLTGEFAIRGSSIDNQTVDANIVVHQACVRTMLTVALFAVLDNAPGPVAVQLHCSPGSNDNTTITLSWKPIAVTVPSLRSSQKHDIAWDDVHAIAEQLGLTIDRRSSELEMHFASAA